MNWIKLIIPAVSLLFLVIPYSIIRNMQLPKLERWKQIRYVWTALGYVVFSCFFFGLFRGIAENLLPSIIWNLFGGSISGSAAEFASVLVFALLANSAILFIYLIPKRIVRSRLRKKFIPPDWKELQRKGGPVKYYWAAQNWIYMLEERTFRLRGSAVRAKYVLKYFVSAVCVMYCAVLAVLELLVLFPQNWLSYTDLARYLSASYIFPAVSVLAVFEISSYLDGYEEFEPLDEKKKTKSVQAEREKFSSEFMGYSSLFASRFADALEISSAVLKDSAALQSTNPEAEAIRLRITEKKGRAVPAYISHIENISDGKDILINDSPYSEFGEYLFRYINMVLSRGESVLFVCPDEQQAERMSDYAQERFLIINGFNPVWKIKQLDSRSGIGLEYNDILITQSQFVYNDQIFDISQKKFFDRLSLVILVNAAETAARDNLSLSLLSFKLAAVLKQRPESAVSALRYICLSENIPLGLQRTLNETLQLKNHLVSGDYFHAAAARKIMLWRYEDSKTPEAQDCVFSSKSLQYWGLALPLACTALKLGASLVSIISETGDPYSQMLDGMKRRMHILDEFFTEPVSDLNRRILINRSSAGGKYADTAVIDDEYSCLPAAINAAKRFGGSEPAVVHVISRPYMLRDYFYDNAQSYTKNESAVSVFMPAAADTLRLSSFRLLYDLYKTGLTEQEILRRASEMTVSASDEPAESVIAALMFCMKTALKEISAESVYNYFSFRKTSVFSDSDSDFKESYFVRFTDQRAAEELAELNRPAVFRIHGQDHQASFLADGISQRYLEGQYIAYGGYSYRIQSIDSAGGTIVLAEGPDNTDIPSGYTQIREYFLYRNSAETVSIRTRNFGNAGNAKAESFVLTHLRMPAGVVTDGYFTHKKTAEQLSYREKPDSDHGSGALSGSRTVREYQSASVLSLKFKMKQAGDTDRSALLLSVLMTEFFRTMFPYSCSCIAVCPVLKNPSALRSDEFGKFITRLYPQMSAESDMARPDEIEVFIIEDSSSDLGVVQALSDNWQVMFGRIFAGLSDYLAWQQSFSGENKNGITNKYLYFGRSKEPECFDFRTLSGILDQISSRRRTDEVKSSDVRAGIK